MKPIYVASRASIPARVDMWIQLRAQGWNIISTWIDEAGPGQTDDMMELWLRIHKEIVQSAGVVLYAELNDFPLKGAYVEAGLALGMGKPVGIVMPEASKEVVHRLMGSWTRHPMVTVWPNVRSAMKIIGE